MGQIRKEILFLLEVRIKIISSKFKQDTPPLIPFSMKTVRRFFRRQRVDDIGKRAVWLEVLLFILIVRYAHIQPSYRPLMCNSPFFTFPSTLGLKEHQLANQFIHSTVFLNDNICVVVASVYCGDLWCLQTKQCHYTYRKNLSYVLSDTHAKNHDSLSNLCM